MSTVVAERTPCPVEGCTYSVEPGASTAGHVAMAHPEVPMDAIAPKRSARNRHTRPAPAVVPPPVGAQLREIPLELIDVGSNVRVDVAELEELAASIAEHGVLQPVKATQAADGRFRLVWGQRRTLAARQAGLATIPAIVEAAGDVDQDGAVRSIEQLVENLHRADLNPIDRAEAMRAVVDSGISQADLARKLGIAPSTVANDLRILAAAPEAKEALRAGEITAAHVKAIASLPKDEQAEWVDEIRRSDASAHDIEEALAARRRQGDWEKEQEAARRKAVEDRKTNALASLEAKGVPLDAQIIVNAGYDGDASARSVIGHLEKSGYTNVEARSGYFSGGRPGAGYCDCTAWLVAVSTWNGSTDARPTCLNRDHADAEQKAKSAKDNEGRAHQEEIRDRVQRLITTSALNLAHESPLAARVLLWIAFDWSLNDWVRDHKGDRKKPNAWDEISALPDGELAVEIAMFIRKGFTDRYNVKLDWERIDREVREALGEDRP